MTRLPRIRPRVGFTLLEIMVVLVILSMLMGIGIGVFAKVGSGPSLALSHITDTVRTARLHAVREKAPSTVRVDCENNRVIGFGWKNVGTWHFEDDRLGESTGFPLSAVLGAARLAENGVIGRCLDFYAEEALSPVGEDRAHSHIPASPSLDSTQGVALQFFLFLKGPGKRTLFTKGSAYRLLLDDDHRLKLVLRLQSPGNSSGIEVALDSGDYCLPRGKWVSLAFQFTGYSSRLVVDGLLRAREDFNVRRRLVPHADKPLRLDGFDCLVDEIRLSAAVTGEDTPFHESIQLEGKTFTIHFDARGFLDREIHSGSVAIEFTHAAKQRYRVLINPMGEVQR